MAPKQPAWPHGHDATTYAALIREAFSATNDRAREASRTFVDPEDTRSFDDWASDIDRAHAFFDRNVGRTRTAAAMLTLAIEATIRCEANGPLGLLDLVNGGLVQRWVDIALAMDPMYLTADPKTPRALARRIATEWSLPSTRDRQIPVNAVILDDAAAQLLTRPGYEGWQDVIVFARACARSYPGLEHAGAVVEHWAAWAAERKPSKVDIVGKANQGADLVVRTSAGVQRATQAAIGVLEAFNRVFDAVEATTNRIVRRRGR